MHLSDIPDQVLLPDKLLRRDLPKPGETRVDKIQQANPEHLIHRDFNR